jgi:hypothetical protein
MWDNFNGPDNRDLMASALGGDGWLTGSLSEMSDAGVRSWEMLSYRFKGCPTGAMISECFSRR